MRQGSSAAINREYAEKVLRFFSHGENVLSVWREGIAKSNHTYLNFDRDSDFKINKICEMVSKRQ